MKSYHNLLLLGAAAMMAACSSDNAPDVNNYNEIAFICDYESSSRATDTNFESNDRIGIYMVAEGTTLQVGGNELNNEPFTFNGSEWKAARRVYWSEGKHTVYAYYPYSKTVNDTEDYTFTVATDQSTHEGYTASDFVWSIKEDVEASASPVKLSFAHRMSRAIIKLEKSEDYEGEIPSDCRVYIHNTVGTASIDLSTGGVSKAPYAEPISIQAQKITDTEFQAIVVPQNIESRRPLVEVVTQGVSYLMEGRLSFRQGYSHTIVVTLSKNPSQTKIEIGGSIGGWN
ncbi:MAG: fimbrillin family protein [Muribaculum sp.]|nr:fimbrillin family protein [Muribaculum sp.]MDE6457271.1 fimbrillin family protein [Muribaculum sp.]